MTTEKRRILSIDGGGIKGVIPAAFLARVENTTGKRIANHFDLIVGTSTGGIIAIGLGLGLTAGEILAFYEIDGPRIFDQVELDKPSLLDRFLSRLNRHYRTARQFVSSKYNADALRSALGSAFGDRVLGESITRLVVPAFDCRRREIHVFKTSHHERYVIDWKERAVDVALATAAAPTYFPSHRMETGIALLDGGIWANNPAGLAAVEAVGVLEWSREKLYILSLGCSEEVFPIPEVAGHAGMALKSTDIFLLGQSRGAIGAAKLLTRHSDTNKRFYRYNEVVPHGTFALDSVKQIATLKGIGASLGRQALPEISSVFLDEPCESFVPFHGKDIRTATFAVLTDDRP